MNKKHIDFDALMNVSDEEDAAILEAALADPDCPPMTEAELARHPTEQSKARARYFQERHKNDAKFVRLAPDVSAHFQKDGVDLETSINSALRRVMEEG